MPPELGLSRKAIFFIAIALFPHSSSASRFTAGAAGFLNLSQCRVRPLTYGEPSRFDTMPSLPYLQAAKIASTIGKSVAHVGIVRVMANS